MQCSVQGQDFGVPQRLSCFVSPFSSLQGYLLSFRPWHFSFISLNLSPCDSGHPQWQDWVENNVFFTDHVVHGCCNLWSSQSALLEASQQVWNFHSDQQVVYTQNVTPFPHRTKSSSYANISPVQPKCQMPHKGLSPKGSCSCEHY